MIADNRHGKPNAKGFWSFTGPRSLASIAQIVIQRLDIVLVGVLIGPVQAAIYTAATRFLVAGQLGNAAISMAAQPQFTKLFAVGDRDGANAVYQATTAWLILLTWPLYLLAVIFGPYVLVIFGHAYHAGSTVMLILGLAMLVATACGQVDMVLITTGRSSWSLYNGLLAMVINVGVDLILIPKVGITGAAIGWAAAIGITNLVPLVQVATAAKVHPFGRGSLAAVLLATFSFAAIPLTVRALAGNGAAAGHRLARGRRPGYGTRPVAPARPLATRCAPATEGPAPITGQAADQQQHRCLREVAGATPGRQRCCRLLAYTARGRSTRNFL